MRLRYVVCHKGHLSVITTLPYPVIASPEVKNLPLGYQYASAHVFIYVQVRITHVIFSLQRTHLAPFCYVPRDSKVPYWLIYALACFSILQYKQPR